MNKRKFLSLSVGSLFTCLLFVFAWVYFYGLTSNSNEVPSYRDESLITLFKNVAVGSIVLEKINKKPVWIVHLSSKQRKQVQQLNGFVLDQAAGCDLNQVYCVLNATTGRGGVYLTYTLEEPPQLLGGIPWYGGFVDPSTSAIYDVTGRAYKQNKDKSIVAISAAELN